ncbi:MAG: hypothetical protein R3A80_09830 [Bdellovibrionota bacterium]
MNTQKAKKLTTKREFDLIEKSRENLDKSQLKSLIDRTRKLRNKYRDLSKSQARKDLNKFRIQTRTVEKAELFQCLLERLDLKLKNKKSSSKSQKMTTKPVKQKAIKKSSKNEVLNQSHELLRDDLAKPLKYSESTRKNRKAKRFAVASSERIGGHISTQNKRNQKKREIQNAH